MNIHVEMARLLLSDALLLLNNHRNRSAASRAYYAAYHACIALAEVMGLRPRSFLGRNGRPASRWEHGIVTSIVVRDSRLESVIGPQSAARVRWLYMQRIRGDYRPNEPIHDIAAQTSYTISRHVLDSVEQFVNAQQP
jgi:hypothetical protein